MMLEYSGCWKSSWMLRMLEIKLYAHDAANLGKSSGCWTSIWMLRMLEVHFDAQGAEDIVGCSGW